MIREIHLENFRPIYKESLPLGKITVLTGANNSGKSSILYSLMVLQDFVMNPNQSLEQLFALPFINLGGFEEVKSKNDLGKEISEFIRLGITASSDRWEDDYTSYNLNLGKGETFLDLSSKKGHFNFSTNLSIGLPYTGLSKVEGEIKEKGSHNTYPARWNGFQTEIHKTVQDKDLRSKLISIFDSPVSSLVATDFIPVSRGFTKPYYNIVPIKVQAGLIFSSMRVPAPINW